MFKKFLAIICLMCLVPMAAQAATWSLNTWVRNAGGTIVVRGGTPQTNLNGSLFKNYTTSNPFTVAVVPNTGFSLSQVNYNGVTTNNPSQTSYTVQGPTAQTVWATFAAQTLSVTASVSGTGGSVSPASFTGITFGTKLTTPRSFVFTPSPATSRVSSITGVPAGATVNSTLPAPAGTSVSVIFPINFTFTSDVAIVGTFDGPPVAKTGQNQVVIPGTLVTLDGSSSTGIISSYIWSQTGGPGFPLTRVFADNTPGALVNFTPTDLGTYTFILTVTGGSTATTSVQVTDHIVDYVRAQCFNCHLGNNVGITQNVFGNWSSSMHKTKFVVCWKCHVGAESGGHPGQLTSGTVSETTFNFTTGSTSGSNFCITCHKPSIITDFNASKHSIAAGAASCSFCHTQGVHNPNTACQNCHISGNTLGLPWPPTGFDFHSSFDGQNLCKYCHNIHNPKTFSFSTNCTQ